ALKYEIVIGDKTESAGLLNTYQSGGLFLTRTDTKKGFAVQAAFYPWSKISLFRTTYIEEP
ncbi:MAG: hypothetical protein KDA57_24050, partial [Planctomycetales bacterium]|nr:hypothetical protein [Planctomycetales bacterium]